MEILDLFTQAVKELKTFENHLLQKATLEEQLSYLNILALMANVDGEMHESELAYIECLVKCFNLESSSLEGILEFAKSPDKETIQDFINSFKKSLFAEAFLFDALALMHCDGEEKKVEIALLKQINLGLSLPIKKQRLIRNMHVALMNNKIQEAQKLLNNEYLDREVFEHITKYYDVKIKLPSLPKRKQYFTPIVVKSN